MVLVTWWLVAGVLAAQDGAPCPRVADVRVVTQDQAGAPVSGRAFVDGVPAGAVPGTLTLPFCGGVLKVTARGFRPARLKLWEPDGELRLTLTPVGSPPARGEAEAAAEAEPAAGDDAPVDDEEPPPRPAHRAARVVTASMLLGTPTMFAVALGLLGVGALAATGAVLAWLFGVPLWAAAAGGLLAGAVVLASGAALTGGIALTVLAFALRRTQYWSEDVETQAILRAGPACMDACLVGCMASSAGCCSPSTRTY